MPLIIALALHLKIIPIIRYVADFFLLFAIENNFCRSITGNILDISRRVMLGIKYRSWISFKK